MGSLGLAGVRAGRAGPASTAVELHTGDVTKHRDRPAKLALRKPPERAKKSLHQGLAGF